MEPNFDKITERRGHNTLKWDSVKDPEMLPMWVADIDFSAPPAVKEALSAGIAHGILGYTIIPPAFNQAITTWWWQQHNCSIEPDWILPVPGILPALSAIIRALLLPGEAVLLQPPVYNKLFTLAENCKCLVVQNELIYKDAKYHIDFDDLERKAGSPACRILLLCNPHNPVGRAWTSEELDRIAAICSRHNVIVVSDEIHADLVHGARKHFSFATVAKNYPVKFIVCGAPSKAFGFSGLAVGYLFCPDKAIKNKILQLLETQGTAAISAFAVDALLAAYTNEKSWLESLKNYVYHNYLYLEKYCAEKMPGIKPVPLEATYLTWLDCTVFIDSWGSFNNQLMNVEKLWVNPGTLYGSAGKGFIRINIACPRLVLTEGLRKLEHAYIILSNKKALIETPK